MKLRRNRPLLLIDIAVPRDIDPEVNFLESVYLYNIDDLQTLADSYLRMRQRGNFEMRKRDSRESRGAARSRCSLVPIPTQARLRD